MRILVISNFYPPYYIGGYELGCYDVVEALKDRGHKVKVLTSTYGVGKPCSDGEVYRLLETDIGWNARGVAGQILKLLKREIINKKAFKQLCNTFKPDVVYAWNLRHISVSLTFLAKQLGIPVCYFVFDNWLSQWESDLWYSLWVRKSRHLMARFGKALLRPFLNAKGLIPYGLLDLRYTVFASHYLKQVALKAGKPVKDAKVIHWGIDTNQFTYKKVSYNPKRLLYVGQIVPHKGIHTAIEAMKILIKEYGYSSLKLTVVGDNTPTDYITNIQKLVYSYNLQDNIHFTGFIPRKNLPDIYHQHDILIFPSIWNEPFGITLLEGMSCGLAVIGTATGGSSEILQDEVNALVFPKEDAKACAKQIVRLLNDPELFERIRQGGRRIVEEKFKFETIVDMLEYSLQEAVYVKLRSKPY